MWLIDTLYGVIAAPRQTFGQLAGRYRADRALLWPAGTVVVVCGVQEGLRAGAWQGGALLPAVAVSALGFVFLWLSLVAVPGVLCLAFPVSRAAVGSFAVTSGFSFLPWVFMGPLSLYGVVLGQGIVLIFWLTQLAWMLYLLYLAVQQSFSLSGKQVLSVLFILPPVILLAIWLLVWQIISSVVALLLT
ncbi:MAG TPA: hypothetical protein V6D08_21380 [Candidatus Obscuribacterales bacterium]